MIDFDHLYKRAEKTFLLPEPTDHGVDHWRRVERNFLAIADSMEFATRTVWAGRMFAIFHDCRRTSEYTDPMHGPAAADFVNHKLTARLKLKKIFGEVLLSDLIFAIRHHSNRRTDPRWFVGACWDADRMDLPRVGISPDPRLMSTDFGREFARKRA